MTQPEYSTTRNLITEKPACFDSCTEGLTTLFKTPDNEHKIAESGLRLKRLYKSSSEEKPLITVVTVVYNGAEYLEDTIKSVIEQTYDNVEYIIVDGGSTDGSLDIIRRYEDAIDYWVSEQDRGIYDAMNKGIDLGSGDWINFMNAGDFFFESETIYKVFFDTDSLFGVGVIYGDHEVRYSNKTKTVKAGDVKNLWKGSQFCHQSAFIGLNYHKNNKFNLCRKIAADFDFFYKSFLGNIAFLYKDNCISRVSSGGVSDTKRLESIKERYSCLEKKHLKIIYYSLVFIYESTKLLVKKIVKDKYR